MKYVLTSGCSFTNNTRYNPKNKLAIDNYRDEDSISWPYYLQKELGDDFEVWNLGGATNDNVSIIRVLFYNIKKLLKKGVDEADIVIVGQFSDINRRAVWVQSDWNWDDELWCREHTFKYSKSDVNNKKNNGYFFLTGGFSPPDEKGGTMDTLGMTRLFQEYDINILSKTYINETLQWLETWSFFENFCIDLDINTYWFWMRNNLKTFNHFFVQNNDSKKILKKYNFNNCSVMGDSRFERVLELPNQENKIKYLNKFKKSKQCFVAGSTWNEDDEIIIKFINSYKENDICFIIAPHQIDLNKINKAKSFIKKKSILMSELNRDNASENSVIFIDSIGLLTSVYSYADIGYVGGGMGNTGLHNTLEPAVFKIPVIVGKNFGKFHEVSELINLKGFISIKNYDTFKNELIDLINNKKARDKMGQINYKYILNKIGASEKVITYLKQKK